MREQLYVSRDAAVSAALKEMRKRLLSSDALCLKVYATMNVLSLFELRGRSRLVISRYKWREAA